MSANKVNSLTPHRTKPFGRLTLWPFRCLLCGCSADAVRVTRDLCLQCEQNLPLAGRVCECCGLPVPENSGPRCGSCLASPMFDACLAPFEYAYPVDCLIKAFKFQKNFAAGNVLAQLFVQHYLVGSGLTASRPELLIPVPLHRRRRLLRGFNQAEELAGMIHRHCRLSLGVWEALRVVYNEPQAVLDKKHREQNLQHVFCIPGKLQSVCKGRHVAVMDDVITTGSTLRALTSHLYAAGAARVSVWAIARTF